MKLRERSAGDVTILELSGRLVLDDGDVLLRERVNDLIGRGKLKFVVDLKDVIYIDSCGLGVLIAKLVSVRNKGGDLKLLHMSPRSHRVFEICKLDDVFDSYDTEDGAVASFTSRENV
jgi:anti-anti-sigma factor